MRIENYTRKQATRRAKTIKNKGGFYREKILIMKKNTKKIIILCVVLVVLVALFVPFRSAILSDGGTIVYSAPLLKIVKWVHIEDHSKPKYYTTSVYFFPNNLKNIDQLKKEYYFGK